MKCLLQSSKNTHWISLNDSNTGLLPWQQAKKLFGRPRECHNKIAEPYQTPRGWQGNEKLMAKNKVFECLTLLKIEVIEYGKMGIKMA